MPSVEVDREDKKVRSSDPNTYLSNRKRCIIILRNVPIDANENEVANLFVNEHCSTSGTIEYERVLEANHADCWYVTFPNEEDAQNAFLYLTRENVSLRGQKILVRLR
jgi:la-related protein 4